MKFKKSQHYVFYYHENSLAEKNINQIISEQEFCYDYICKTLELPMDFVIQYFLCNTPEEVGAYYGDNSKCNGFNRLPDKVYAVYSDKIKCIGFHEDAHLISYHYIARPDCVFLREGLAMFFDKKWYGISNLEWTEKYYKEKLIPKIEYLVKNEIFFSYDCELTYPISGAFTEYLINAFGILPFKQIFSDYDRLKSDVFQKYYNKALDDLEKEFLDSLSKTIQKKRLTI